MKVFAWAVVALLSGLALAASPTGDEILARMDKNRDYTSISMDATMRIIVGGQTRVKTMTIRSKTLENKSLVEFTNPEDRGTRYLMLQDNLWIYFPDEQDTVKISGHMLKEGMMGSDVSYEDALEGDTLSQKYTITSLPEETLDGRLCYVLALDAKVPNVPYTKRKMWVDQERYVVLKEEMAAKTGKLLKVSRVLEVQNVGGRFIPSKSEVVNPLKKDSKTVFEMTNVKFGETMPDEWFTHRYLER